MNIQEILKQQATWTYDMIAGSTALGEVIREDALTSVNLTIINNMAKANNIPISITSMQGANLEKEFGADWSWTDGSRSYLVQAKKINVARKIDLMSYAIEIPQLLNLQAQADIMTKFYGRDIQPIYIFYNSLLPIDLNKIDWGCTAVQSETLINYLEVTGQIENKLAIVRFSEIGKHMIPWYRLFETNSSIAISVAVPGQSSTKSQAIYDNQSQSDPFPPRPSEKLSTSTPW